MKSITASVIKSAAFLVLTLTELRAADVTATWLSGSGNWSDPTRWNSNSLFDGDITNSSGSAATFNNAGTFP